MDTPTLSLELATGIWLMYFTYTTAIHLALGNRV